MAHVTDIEVLDRMESSQYNKLMTYWRRDKYPRLAGVCVCVRKQN